MASHKRSEVVLTRVKDVVEDCLKEGFFPPDLPSRGRAAHTEAAKRLAEHFGWPESTAWKWIRAANENETTKPDYTLFRPYQYQAFGKTHSFRPHVVMKPGADRKRLALIGDAHDAPAIPDKSRFLWMGRWCADQDFDEIWQIGDMCTLDSLTRHAPPGTVTFANLPSYKEDLDSLRDALKLFDKGLGGAAIPKTITLGNHEHRAKLYEDKNPQMAGCIHNVLEQVFLDHGWRVIPYGEMVFTCGVGLTHHPTNIMGKAYGGKTANQRAGSDSVVSVFHGHDHKLELSPSPKIGPMGHVDMVSIGCALPQNMIEDYAKHGPSGWSWGVCSSTVCEGKILDFAFTSMDSLERTYG